MSWPQAATLNQILNNLSSGNASYYDERIFRAKFVPYGCTLNSSIKQKHKACARHLSSKDSEKLWYSVHFDEWSLVTRIFPRHLSLYFPLAIQFPLQNISAFQPFLKFCFPMIRDGMSPLQLPREHLLSVYCHIVSKAPALKHAPLCLCCMPRSYCWLPKDDSDFPGHCDTSLPFGPCSSNRMHSATLCMLYSIQWEAIEIDPFALFPGMKNICFFTHLP